MGGSDLGVTLFSVVMSSECGGMTWTRGVSSRNTSSEAITGSTGTFRITSSITITSSTGALGFTSYLGTSSPTDTSFVESS